MAKVRAKGGSFMRIDYLRANKGAIQVMPAGPNRSRTRLAMPFSFAKIGHTVFIPVN
jgi:hypothetical protein